jgi:hypothetical protein
MKAQRPVAEELNTRLLRFQKQHPFLFLLLAAGLGFLFGGVLILILRLLDWRNK